MAELLNLDELVTVKRTVTVKGTEYALAEQTVDQMIDGINQSKKAAQELNKEASVEDTLAEMKKVCINLIPDCPAEIIGGLTMRQMIALIEFAGKTDDEVEQAANDGVGSEGNAQ